MKKTMWLVLIVVAVIAVAMLARTAMAQRGNLVTICHHADGQRQTIRVAPESVPMHQAHGDTLGPCPVSPTL